MSADLTQMVRLGSPNERRFAAFELGKKGTDDAFEELYRMVNAKVRTFTKRSIKTLWRQLPVYYDLDDQLTGIEALGLTQRPEALDFLKKIYLPSIVEVRKEFRCGDIYYHAMWDPTCRWIEEHHSYPHAKGALASALAFSVDITPNPYHRDRDWANVEKDRLSRDKIDEECQNIILKNKAHQLIREAIARLDLHPQGTSTPPRSLLSGVYQSIRTRDQSSA